MNCIKLVVNVSLCNFPRPIRNLDRVNAAVDQLTFTVPSALCFYYFDDDCQESGFELDGLLLEFSFWRGGIRKYHTKIRILSVYFFWSTNFY